MSRFPRFLLVLVPVSLSFVLTPHDLHKSVNAEQKELRLTEWHVIVRSLSAHDMYVTNQCECFGESMIFPASKITVVNILDDEAYKDRCGRRFSSLSSHSTRWFQLLVMRNVMCSARIGHASGSPA